MKIPPESESTAKQNQGYSMNEIDGQTKRKFKS